MQEDSPLTHSVTTSRRGLLALAVGGALAALGVISLALWAGAYIDSTGSQMASAASRFLSALDQEQAAKATYAFDAPERLDVR